MRRRISPAHQLADTLGRAIIGGRFDGGDFPNESELSLDFGASPAVVREAVKILIGKGLASARPGLGTVVEPPAHWSLLDRQVLGWMALGPVRPDLLSALIDLRAGVEPSAAGLAARHADQADRAIILDAVQRLAASGRTEAQTIAAMAALQTALLDATRNPFYAGLAPVLNTALELCARTRTAGQLADDAAWLGAAADAIMAGDEGVARATVERGLFRLSAGRLD